MISGQDNTKLVEKLISQLPGCAYLKNKDGRFLYCNNLFAKTVGLSRGEIIGKTDYELPWKTSANLIKKTELEILASGVDQTLEETFDLNNSSKIIFLSNKGIFSNEQGAVIGILCIASDITKQKQHEKELQTTKSKTEIALENILNNTPAHIFWKDRNCVLLGCNELQAKTLGYSNAKDMIGKTNYELQWPNLPDNIRKSQAEALTKHDLEVMNTGVTYTAEEPLVLSDGSTAIYVSKKTPLRNEEGEVVGMLGISFDITEQKKIERKLFETQHKLEGMTLISAAIAHELSTPLAAFGIAADNIKFAFPYLKQAYLWAKEQGAPIDEDNIVDLRYLENTLASMRKEIEYAFTFMDIAQKKTDQSVGRGRPELLSISDVVDNVLSRYPFIIGQRELVQWEHHPNVDFIINSDKVLITHVFFNLLKNALYYVAKAGKGNIQIWLEQGSPYNKLYFKDTGTGIANDILPYIFDRFFSRADRGTHGAGVGLTLCKEVVESLKGGITCESVEGDYTLFILSFPSNI